MNITFKKITYSDLSFVNEVRNTYCEEYLHNSKKFTLEQAQEWYTKSEPDWYIIKFNNQNIGYFRLSNYSKENQNIYLGADICPFFTGKGYAREAYTKFIPFLFDEYDLNKISLEVLSSNKRAINLYTSLGFVSEGVKRQEIKKNFGWVDSIIMSILRKDYES